MAKSHPPTPPAPEPTTSDADKAAAPPPPKPGFRPASTEVGAKTTEEQQAKAAEEQQRKADEGHPDQNAQINLAASGGPAAIRTALDSLPPIPALDGLKANWEHYSTQDLVSALESLPLPAENEGALRTRDEIVKRLQSG